MGKPHFGVGQGLSSPMHEHAQDQEKPNSLKYSFGNTFNETFSSSKKNSDKAFIFKNRKIPEKYKNLEINDK